MAATVFSSPLAKVSPVALSTLESRQSLIAYNCLTVLPDRKVFSEVHRLVTKRRYSHIPVRNFSSLERSGIRASANSSDADGPSQRVGSRRRGRPRKIRPPEDEASKKASPASEVQGEEASWTESSDEASGSDGEGSGLQRGLGSFRSSDRAPEESSAENVAISPTEIVLLSDESSSSDDVTEGSDAECQDYVDVSLESDWPSGFPGQPTSATGGRAAGGLPPPAWRQNPPPPPPPAPAAPCQLVCIGEAVREFVPVVRRSSRQAPDEIFATWRNLQWVPPDFARAPGGPACQVAVALARLNADVAFVGAVGDDEAGEEFLEILSANGVSTHGVDMRSGVRTGVKLVTLEKGGGDGAGEGMGGGDGWRVGFPLAEDAGDVAEEGEGEVGDGAEERRGRGVRSKNLGKAATGAGLSEEAREVLTQASWAHCTAMSLATPSDRTALLSALDAAGCRPLSSPSSSSPSPSLSLTPTSPSSSPSPHSPPRLFFDINLPLCLWRSRASALAAIEPVWRRASIVEVSRAEAEFLVGEERFLRRRQARVRYASDSYLTLRGEREEGEGEGVYHWQPEELAGLWHEGMELLLVTHGTMQVHYYGRGFHGWVEGTEDVLIAAMTCDRAGSGDALVAGLLRKLATNPDILHNPDALERAIRFAISAGVISSWTTGAVRSFPSEEATQNLTEQMFLPSMI